MTHPLRLKYPIVLVHGLGARDAYGPVEYFFGLPKMLRDAGNFVVTPRLTAFHSMEHRAAELRRQIEALIPEGKVNLIGHSFGGLDARYLVSRLGFGERTASLTTIGTPNKGTIICDMAMGLVPDSAFHLSEKVLSIFKASGMAYQQITTKFATESGALENVPGVGYFSATSVIANPIYTSSLPLFWLPHRIVKRYEGENDGFVSEQSAKLGEHICTYKGDHYAQIGQFMGYARGLDYIAFYTEIISRLKAEGF